MHFVYVKITVYMSLSVMLWWLVWRSGNGVRHINEIQLYVEPG